ncbi:DUF924 family protein [Roseomonas hellenica]|uniref:DUF924 family protein n=2 Tax=Plastoroseomonas hellenica TaxID=2687306 RepID=A0ABS5EXT4_9PROT|nr:DUF924 family protein [Plastoroseomonas hellenica]
METAMRAMESLVEAGGLDSARAVVDFWRAAGPGLWFAKDPGFDDRFRRGFLAAHEAAARSDGAGWLATPEGALGLVLLLDQFPRNAFRGTRRMYATDATARAAAAAAIAAGHDQGVETALRLFLYLPFAHSEDLADQDRSVALVAHLGEPNLTRARRHRDIIRRFARFPHRNPILGRAMRAEEQRYLDAGGYAG